MKTEWIETVEAGWNVLAGTDMGLIVLVTQEFVIRASRPMVYGNGQAAEERGELLWQ